MVVGEANPVGLEFRHLNEHVYSELLGLIVRRQLAPGQRLHLEEVAARLQVSITPVRTALSRLAGEGLVEPTGRSGYRVTVVTPEAVKEIYQLRLMCEQFAIEQGMGMLTAEVLEVLAKTVDEYSRLSASTDPAEKWAYVQQDKDFHRIIVGLCRNPRLSEFFDRLNVHIQNLRVNSSRLSAKEFKDQSHAEHVAILEALRSGDPVLAKNAVRDHILNARQRLLLTFEAEPPG